MITFDVLLERNRTFAEDVDARRKLIEMPGGRVFVITCIDPRVHPSLFLGIGIGDGIVARNAGGRVTDAVIADVAFIAYLGETVLGAGDGPPLEVAVVHHTNCGTGFLADDDVRRAFAKRTGFDEDDLADEAVTDPELTVRTDVERLRSSPLASPRIVISGHVFDLATGLVHTVVPASAPHAAHQESRA
jgi:carbonic anhydrase